MSSYFINKGEVIILAAGEEVFDILHVFIAEEDLELEDEAYTLEDLQKGAFREVDYTLMWKDGELVNEGDRIDE
jgi:hypothetical protein